MTGRIIYIETITREMLKENPEARFVFGDNAQRFGMGGQAKSMRGEPNAIGVATKRSPTMEEDAFFCDESMRDIITVMGDLKLVKMALNEDRDVYVSKFGLGTGLSQLPERAPGIYKYIAKFFQKYNKDKSPWGV